MEQEMIQTQKRRHEELKNVLALAKIKEEEFIQK